MLELRILIEFIRISCSFISPPPLSFSFFINFSFYERDAISYDINMVEMHPQAQGHVYENQGFEGDKVGHHQRYKTALDFGHGFQHVVSPGGSSCYR
ncbi:hypothetical protein RIF29_21134 [Crotalaria pallida]|uniref:Uncharacterized protein n=1 Tax=Crotalaria pallida TaxID=3830 RepID=A0AAN9ID45_CROPI